VLLVALAAACGGEEEETPTGTGTPAATGSPATSVVGTATSQGTTTAPSGATGPGITDTEIHLGAEVILSGSMGAVYATIPQTVDAYFDYINDTQGGVCGRKIVYQYEDNKDDPAIAVEVARKLVEKDEVFAMVGSLGDSPHPASWEYLNERGVPDILVSAGGHRFGADPEGHPWTVQMIPSYTVEGTFFGQYISRARQWLLCGRMTRQAWMGSPA
jgi:branched-chain amino acid transport system substrate-binding protein